LSCRVVVWQDRSVTLEDEIHELLSKQTRTDPKLFESLISGEEVAVSADDLLGIILKQDALEHALLRVARRVDEL